MISLIKILVLTMLLSLMACTAPGQQSGLAEQNPSLNPPKKLEIFEPGVVTQFDRWSFTPTFSRDMKTLVYVAWKDPDRPGRPYSIQKLYTSRYVDGKWSQPVEIMETSGERIDWPHFTPDGKYFLLSFTRAHSNHYNFPGNKSFDDFDIWIAPTNEGGEIDWKSFKPLEGPDLNRTKTPENSSIGYVHNETAPRMDLEGNLYFWTERLDDGGGRRDIYVANSNDYTELSFNKAELLPEPINSEYKESGGVISPDGKWMIFSSERPGGIGGADLYFSRKTKDGWTKPKNLGPGVNSAKNEIAPELSPDGRALFFTSNRKLSGVSPQSRGEGSAYNAIYWISVDSLKAD